MKSESTTRKGTKAPQPELSATPSDQKVIKVKSLSDLQSICDETLTVELEFDANRIFHVEARRLRPFEDAALEEISTSVLPPTVKSTVKGEDDKLNFNDAVYRKQKKEVDLQARALGLYWCVPIFSAERNGLTDRKMIAEFVQGQFSEQVLDVLWQAIRDGGVKVARLVNFTSPSISHES